MTHGQHVVNLFTPYSNVLAFAVGNEVINSLPRWRAAPCVKAYARDIRRFMSSCHASDHSRVIPLLYAAADNAIAHFPAEENDRMKMDFLTCTTIRGGGGGGGGGGEGGEEAVEPDSGDERSIDLIGLNLFRWCSDQCSFHSCESAKVVAAFVSSPIPVLLTEYGCAQYTFHLNHTERVGTNPFAETSLLYSPAMTQVFSGGFAYTYGVRGGAAFAFFGDGGRTATGKPGSVKSCGWPDNSCRIEQYEQRLAEVAEQEAERKNAAAVQDADGGEGGDGMVEEGEAMATACPVILGVDLSIADSRQGAEGYEAVPCQAGVGRQATSEEREAEEEQGRVDREAEAAERNRTAAAKAAADEAPADASPPEDAPAEPDREPAAAAPAKPAVEPPPEEGQKEAEVASKEKDASQGEGGEDRGRRQEDGARQSSSGEGVRGAAPPSTSDVSRVSPSLLLVLVAACWQCIA